MSKLVIQKNRHPVVVEKMASLGNKIIDSLPDCFCGNKIYKAHNVNHNYGGLSRKIKTCSKDCKNELTQFLGSRATHRYIGNR